MPPHPGPLPRERSGSRRGGSRCGLLDLKRSSILVYVQTLSDNHTLVPIQPNFRNIITRADVGIDQQAIDPDLVSRRFAEDVRYEDGTPMPTLAGQMLRRMGRPVESGYIDYSLGAPLEYVSLHSVTHWDEDRLRKEFANRIVVIGSLIGRTDRWRLPVRLLARDPGRLGGVSASQFPLWSAARAWGGAMASFLPIVRGFVALQIR